MTVSILKNCRTNETEMVPRLAGKIRDELFSRKFIRDIEKNGPDDVRCTYTLSDRDYRELVSIIKENTPVKRRIFSEREKKEYWCKRLSKLSGVDFQTALMVAEEKIDYKWKQIDMLRSKQDDHYSKRREDLINFMSRQNPLRYIEDEEHALNILKAYKRHNFSNYDELLEEGHLLAEEGEIDRRDVRAFARHNLEDKKDAVADKIVLVLNEIEGNKNKSVLNNKNERSGMEM